MHLGWLIACSSFLHRYKETDIFRVMKTRYDKKIISKRDKVQKKKLFTIIPIEISNDKTLKNTEKLILAEIVTMQVYAGEFNGTNQYLADLLNLSRSSISRIINDLRHRGYIRSYQHFDPDDKMTYKRTLHANVFLDCEVFKQKRGPRQFNWCFFTLFNFYLCLSLIKTFVHT